MKGGMAAAGVVSHLKQVGFLVYGEVPVVARHVAFSLAR
jgi:hypothetical protein